MNYTVNDYKGNYVAIRCGKDTMALPVTDAAKALPSIQNSLVKAGITMKSDCHLIGVGDFIFL